MGKGANQQLLSNSGVAQSNAKQLYQAGGNIGGPLTATLENEANNPQGYTPQQLAYMDTASQQSLGGGASASTGEADLDAARTRNAGGFQGAVGTADRSAQKQLSQNALGIQSQQANLQQQQKQQALSSLQSLYGVDEATALSYLDSSTSALKEENQGSQINTNDFWKDVQGTEQVAGMSGSGGG